jgi:hypothetical protein
MKKQILLQSKIDSPTAFCIVHWNAPDFLLLTVSQIELLYPNCKIYILDNGSQQIHLTSIKAGLKKFNNVTLFALLVCPKWAKKLGLYTLFEWQSHTAGLQFLLNYSAKQSDEIAVFLDQDCILTTRVDELFSKFSENIILIGARDYVIVPTDYGPLKKGKIRGSYDLIHPSFMIMQPNRINQLFGNSSFYDERPELLEYYVGREASHPEQYHGLSFKASGRILFVEPRMHAKIPFLTSYAYNENIFAWHAWYSSRTFGIKCSSLNGYPVSWLREMRKIEYDFMMQVHRNTTADLKISNNE